MANPENVYHNHTESRFFKIKSHSAYIMYKCVEILSRFSIAECIEWKETWDCEYVLFEYVC